MFGIRVEFKFITSVLNLDCSQFICLPLQNYSRPPWRTAENGGCTRAHTHRREKISYIGPWPRSTGIVTIVVQGDINTASTSKCLNARDYPENLVPAASTALVLSNAGRSRQDSSPYALEVLLEGESVGRTLVAHRRHDTSLLVVTHALLKEVGLALERDHVHPLEGVGGVVLCKDRRLWSDKAHSRERLLKAIERLRW